MGQAVSDVGGPEEMIVAKDAAKIAMTYVAELLADEGPSNFRIEEVESTEGDEKWLITVSFLRDEPTYLGTFPTGSAHKVRNAKVVEIRKNYGWVLAMRSRDAVHSG